MADGSATSLRPSAAGGLAASWRLAEESPFSWTRWRNLHEQLVHLVAVELRLLHNRSVVGMAWALVNPIAQLVVFTAVLGRVLTVDTPHYAVFLCCGLLCWNAFSESLTMTTHAAADHVAFFETMLAGATRAEEQAGYGDHHYAVAGHAVRLRIAGSGFAAKLPTALGHLSADPAPVPALTIHAWDDVSTGTTLPTLLARYLHFVQMHCFDYLGPRNSFCRMPIATTSSPAFRCGPLSCHG